MTSAQNEDRRHLLKALVGAPFMAVLMGTRGANARIAAGTLQPAPETPLASWNDGAAKQAILDFVRVTTDASNANFVKPEARIAQEVMKYLRANGYKTYIVTGGGQDFVRVYSEATYGVPPEQVVGTAGGTKYGYAQGLPTTKVGAFAQTLYDEAKKSGGVLISMKEDWKRVFSFDT